MKDLSFSEYAESFHDTGCPAGDFSLGLIQPEDCSLPRREATSHKYNYGRALIIAGSTGFSGAAALAANACERGGAGLTRLMVPESIYAIAAARCDGAVVTPVPADGKGAVSAGAVPLILSQLEHANACAIGPGLGLGDDQAALVEAVLRNAACPVVLDADALTICSREPELISLCRAPVILTPHGGEFRRLGGDLAAGRLAGALGFCAGHGEVILVLKGHGTLVCRGREAAVNPTGSAAMAKGGSGDVLTGLLCALLAQGFEPLFSARCAVYLHGLAGDLACGEKGEYSVTPSDIVDRLPEVFKSVLSLETRGEIL